MRFIVAGCLLLVLLGWARAGVAQPQCVPAEGPPADKPSFLTQSCDLPLPERLKAVFAGSPLDSDGTIEFHTFPEVPFKTVLDVAVVKGHVVAIAHSRKRSVEVGLPVAYVLACDDRLTWSTIPGGLGLTRLAPGNQELRALRASDIWSASASGWQCLRSFYPNTILGTGPGEHEVYVRKGDTVLTAGVAPNSPARPLEPPSGWKYGTPLRAAADSGTLLVQLRSDDGSVSLWTFGPGQRWSRADGNVPLVRQPSLGIGQAGAVLWLKGDPDIYFAGTARSWQHLPETAGGDCNPTHGLIAPPSNGKHWLATTGGLWSQIPGGNWIAEPGGRPGTPVRRLEYHPGWHVMFAAANNDLYFKLVDFAPDRPKTSPDVATVAGAAGSGGGQSGTGGGPVGAGGPSPRQPQPPLSCDAIWWRPSLLVGAGVTAALAAALAFFAGWLALIRVLFGVVAVALAVFGVVLTQHWPYIGGLIVAADVVLSLLVALKGTTPDDKGRWFSIARVVQAVTVRCERYPRMASVALFAAGLVLVWTGPYSMHSIQLKCSSAWRVRFPSGWPIERRAPKCEEHAVMTLWAPFETPCSLVTLGHCERLQSPAGAGDCPATLVSGCVECQCATGVAASR